uniref:Uncharacterized protein n=1 Tax=Buteo japonicus TaxID=224669 RepID=A0A8C0BNL0_9AVES
MNTQEADITYKSGNMTSYLQTRTDRPLPVTVRDAGQDSSLSKSSTDFWLDNRRPSLHGYMDKICTDFTGSLDQRSPNKCGLFECCLKSF